MSQEYCGIGLHCTVKSVFKWIFLGPTFMFRVDRSVVYTGWIQKDFLYKYFVKSFFRILVYSRFAEGPSWLWSYGSWIYNFPCNQCQSPLKLWVQTPFMVRCTCYNIIWYEDCQWLVTGQWFSPSIKSYGSWIYNYLCN